jgi:hypothetical protein
MCMVAIVLWVSAGVLAQGQGKGQGGGDKGKAAKQADEGTAKRGKKGQTPTDTSDEGKGKGQEKQAQAFQKQQQHEQAKHMERVAKLNRIRELAAKKGDTEMVARVDKLLAKENEVYTRKLGKGPGQARAAGTAGPNDVGARKGKAPGAEQKGKSGKRADEGVKEQKKNEAKPEKGEK